MSEEKGMITVQQAEAPRSVDDVLAQVEHIQNFMRKALKEGVHYGVIPGCGDKPTLLQPGAQKLCFLFRLQIIADAPLITELGDRHREYISTVKLFSQAGNLMGSGTGSCSTLEPKYRYRAGQENPDPAGQYNTCLKMAEKRALVAATLRATAAGDLFTQDIEDDPSQYQRSGGSADPITMTLKTSSVVKPPARDGDKWNGYKYKYNLPFKSASTDMEAVRKQVRALKMAFRGKKNKDGTPNADTGADNCWYSDLDVEELRQFQTALKAGIEDDIPPSAPIDVVAAQGAASLLDEEF